MSSQINVMVFDENIIKGLCSAKSQNMRSRPLERSELFDDIPAVYQYHALTFTGSRGPLVYQSTTVKCFTLSK